MEITDLDLQGFAEFLNKSSAHLYGILNGTRPLSESLAKEIGDKLGFEGTRIFNLNASIPQYIIRAESLTKFKADNRDNAEYFLSTKPGRSIDTFISEVLLKSSFLNDCPRYLKEITRYCKETLHREFRKDELSKGLRYAVDKGLLKSAKKPLLRNDGSLGNRMVDVYFKRR